MSYQYFAKPHGGKGKKMKLEEIRREIRTIHRIEELTQKARRRKFEKMKKD